MARANQIPRRVHLVKTPMRALFVGVVAGLSLNSVGCADIGWFARQGVGQVELLANARPVARVLEDNETDPAVKQRLQLVVAAKNFAKSTLGLNVSHQYRSVTFLDRTSVVYVVTAAPRTSLDPYLWTYPVVGALPYRGYFSLEEAEAAANALEAEEDVYVDVRTVSTYSLLGILPDPIVSPMLFVSDEAYLVETVIHELAHATVFAAGQGAFNEGMATFIGREGLRQFVAKHYGSDSAIFARVRQVRADREVYARAVAALAFDLRVLFAQRESASAEEILARKDAIFLEHQRHYEVEVAGALETFWLRRARLPDNNAELAAYGIYSLQQQLYERAFAACQEDLRCFIQTMKNAAREDDAELWLGEHLRDAAAEPRVLP